MKHETSQCKNNHVRSILLVASLKTLLASFLATDSRSARFRTACFIGRECRNSPKEHVVSISSCLIKTHDKAAVHEPHSRGSCLADAYMLDSLPLLLLLLMVLSSPVPMSPSHIRLKTCGEGRPPPRCVVNDSSSFSLAWGYSVPGQLPT